MNKGNKLGPLVALEKHEMRLTANLPVVTAMHCLAFPAWTCGLNNGLGLTPQVTKQITAPCGSLSSPLVSDGVVVLERDWVGSECRVRQESYRLLCQQRAAEKGL